MDDKTTKLIEKLSAQLGTTAEHLWGVLVHQAPLTGAFDLVIIVIMVLCAVYLVRLVKRKTKKYDNNNQYIGAEWDNEVAAFTWFGTIVYLIITMIVVSSLGKEIIAAFFNPEYWALTQILKKI